MEHVGKPWQLCHNYVQDRQNYMKYKRKDKKRKGKEKQTTKKNKKENLTKTSKEIYSKLIK